jgi:phage replication-related protein YjqB (UPF0714/DUF867 family)
LELHIFEGRLRVDNFKKLHITSTLFREPKFLALASRAPFFLSFHGTGKTRKPIVYVGGLWANGRRTLIDYLSNLAGISLQIKDATREAVVEEIAGRSPQNLTNRGLSGEGIQLEFSKSARDLSDVRTRNDMPNAMSQCACWLARAKMARSNDLERVHGGDDRRVLDSRLIG